MRQSTPSGDRTKTWVRTSMVRPTSPSDNDSKVVLGPNLKKWFGVG